MYVKVLLVVRGNTKVIICIKHDVQSILSMILYHFKGILYSCLYLKREFSDHVFSWLDCLLSQLYILLGTVYIREPLLWVPLYGQRGVQVMIVLWSTLVSDEPDFEFCNLIKK